MRKTALLFITLLLIPVFFIVTRPASAAVLMKDNFENGLSGWEITGSGVTTVKDPDKGSTHNKILKVSYNGNNQSVVIKKQIPSSISGKPNLVYEIQFKDDPSKDYGAGFYILGTDQKSFIGFYVDGNSANYILRNGGTSFDTKIPRSAGWHKIQIFATQVGTYLAIDGRSLVYLRAQIPYPDENATSFPINNDLKSVSEVGVEYPLWNKPASVSYWDSFKVSEFRVQNRTTSQKEEDLLMGYLASYETNLGSSSFQTAITQLKADQNFHLSLLGLAAAYGVRYKVNGKAGDFDNFEKYLTLVVNDYWGAWQHQGCNDSYCEQPISGQAIALLASWQWPNLEPTLKDNIKKVLDDIGAITNQRCISSMFNGYNPDGTINDSKGEEFAWMSSYLKFVADVYHDVSTTACGSNDPATTKWSYHAANLACAATTHADPLDPKKVDGSDICQGINPPNPALTKDFILRNHNMDHPGYALTIAWGMAQAQLYQFNQGKSGNQIDSNYKRNFTPLYNANIASLIRFSNYTYKAAAPSEYDRILAYTGKDDWGQDATLQDQAWAYFDKIFSGVAELNWTNTLDPVVNYAWLTRAGGSIYPALVDANLSPWMGGDTIPCGPYTCAGWKANSAVFFFLNSMDAIDRFETLFIIDPGEYKLNLLESQVTPTPTPVVLLGDLNGDGRVDITDFNIFKSNFGKTGSGVVGDIDGNGKVDIFDYNILVGNFGK